MKIYRPDNLAVLYRSYQFAQRNTLAIGMMGLFHFDRSRLAELRPEPELWAAVAQALGSNAILDEGFAKPAAEYKVYGAAHAPGGAAVEELAVGVQVGGLSKQLIVSGDRHFNMAGLISATQPFTRMPLTPQTAFGGPAYAANPQGKGHAKSGQGNDVVWPLPNVETMHRRIGNRGDVADPAGFWGYDAAAPLRQRHMGLCDDRWLKRTWPHLPVDTRPEYFLTAAPDQRFPAYLKGGEALEMHNLHPQRPVLRAHLPNLRARCFVNRRLANKFEEFSEVEARAETVWLFPELECGIVLYRGQAVTADADASDVLQALVEWESLDNAPLSFEHYHALLRQKMEQDGMVVAPATPPAEVAEPAVVEAPAAPAVPAAAAAVATTAAATVAAVAAPPEAFQQVYSLAAQLEQETLSMLQKNGLTPADAMRFLKPEVEPPAMSFAEVEKMAHDLDRETREMMAKNNLTDADVKRYLKPEVAEKKTSLKDLKGMLQDLDQQTHDMLKKNGMSEKDVEQVFKSRPELAESLQNLQGSQASRVDIAALPDAFPQLSAPAAPDAAVAAAAFAVPAIPAIPTMPAPEAGAQQLTREQVVARHAARESLHGYDLSGVDLSKLDLSGADFSGCVMSKTSFAASKLARANFAGALLQQADFSDSDLSGASLHKVSADGGKFAKAKLAGAQLQDADFSGADFTEAQLEGADMSGGVFDRAAMGKAHAAGCRADQASFAEADLGHADFSKASLHAARFTGGKLNACNFSGAQCDHAEFYGAQAAQAKFDGANLQASRADRSSGFMQAGFTGAALDRACWAGAVLHNAVLDKAVLDDADFSNVAAGGASFRGASAKGTRLGGADLSKADLTAVNLFKGSLRKSDVKGALLRNANLYGVDFEGTQPTIAMLEGSNIDQTILRFRAPVI